MSPTPSLSSSLIHSALLSPYWSGLPSVEMENDRLSSLIFNIAYTQRSLLSYSSILYLQTYSKEWTSRFNWGRILLTLPASWLNICCQLPRVHCPFCQQLCPTCSQLLSRWNSIPRFNPVMGCHLLRGCVSDPSWPVRILAHRGLVGGGYSSFAWCESWNWWTIMPSHGNWNWSYYSSRKKEVRNTFMSHYIWIPN